MAQGQAQGVLDPGDPRRGHRAVCDAAGIATLINGSLVVPEPLDGIVETAVDRGGDEVLAVQPAQHGPLTCNNSIAARLKCLRPTKLR
jgi:hypothetical protein